VVAVGDTGSPSRATTQIGLGQGHTTRPAAQSTAERDGPGEPGKGPARLTGGEFRNGQGLAANRNGKATSRILAAVIGGVVVGIGVLMLLAGWRPGCRRDQPRPGPDEIGADDSPGTADD